MQAEGNLTAPTALAGSFQAAAAAGRPSTYPTTFSLATTCRSRAFSAGLSAPPPSAHSLVEPSLKATTKAAQSLPEGADRALSSLENGEQMQSAGAEAESRVAHDLGSQAAAETRGQSGAAADGLPEQNGDAAVSVSTSPGLTSQVWARHSAATGCWSTVGGVVVSDQWPDAMAVNKPQCLGMG